MKNQAITLGRVGILLPIAAILLFWVPIIGQLIGLAIPVLLLISHYNFSKAYEKPAIFKNMLIGAIIPIITSIIGGIIMGIALAAAAVSIQDPESLGMQQISNLIFESGLTIIAAIIMLAGLIIGYYYIYKALTDLAKESEIKHFKTAGLLYFVGAIGIIVFFLGTIVMLVGWIFHIVAYFSIQSDKEKIEGSS